MVEKQEAQPNSQPEQSVQSEQSEIQPDTQPPMQPVQSEQPAQPVMAPNAPPQPPVKVLKGVGGWLLFLVIALMVLSPLRIWLSYFMERAESKEGGYALWLTILTVWLVVAGYRLWRRHVWRSVRFAIMAMWMVSVGPNIIALALIYLMAGEMGPQPITSSDIVADLFTSLWFPMGWTIYLLRSERVRNTYPKDPPIEELARGMGVSR